jgi:phosphoserine aminotransferase
MKRVYNYSAGPSMLPVEVLEQAQKEMLCYGESGMSVMEMSHRSKDFEAIIKQAEQDLRELMHIPDNYKVLFVQGGGSTQFAMVPLNLMNKNKKANYINTGQWAKKAYAEAKRYGDVKVIASSEDAVYN